MKVLVLMGGISLERDVSLASGAAISAALKIRGHEVIALDSAQGSKLIEKETQLIPNDIKTIPPNLSELARYDREQSIKLAALDDLRVVDVIFLAFHGGAGEDGTIQALLELANKKYTGSGVLASALAMNKALSKKLFEREKIPTPRWTLLKSKTYSPDSLSDLIRKFPPPVIIKPNDQGSTVGLTLVENESAYSAAVEKAFAVSDEVLIEEYIEGRELTVAVLGDEPLPVVEILPKNRLYDYECKYTEGMCSYECPADLSDEMRMEIQRLGLKAFDTLNCRGYARIDFRMDRQGNLYCLEVNTLPGMTKTSLVPKAAKVIGIEFDDLIERIVKLAVEA